MKYFLFPSLLFILIAFSDVQAQVQKYDIPETDSLSIIKPVNPLDIMPEETSKMPILNFPENAKMLVWWPKTKYNYNMPNLLKFHLTQSKIETLNGKELKEEDLNQ